MNIHALNFEFKRCYLICIFINILIHIEDFYFQGVTMGSKLEFISHFSVTLELLFCFVLYF